MLIDVHTTPRPKRDSLTLLRRSLNCRIPNTPGSPPHPLPQFARNWQQTCFRSSVGFDPSRPSQNHNTVNELPRHPVAALALVYRGARALRRAASAVAQSVGQQGFHHVGGHVIGHEGFADATRKDKAQAAVDDLFVL